MAQSRLSIRFVGDVDPALKQHVAAFARWLRQWYWLETPLVIKFVHVDCFLGDHGDNGLLRWSRTEDAGEPVIGELAVATISRIVDREEASAAYYMVLTDIGRILKYYFQTMRESPIRNDYAETWANKLVEAYVHGTMPPAPYRGAQLEDA